MSFKFGVSTSETPTSVQPGRSAPSALPCVVGVAPWWTAEQPLKISDALKPRSIRSFAAYQKEFGAANQLATSGWANFSLDSFSRCWWLYGGRGEAFIWNVLDPTLGVVSSETIAIASGTVAYALTSAGSNPYVTSVDGSSVTYERGVDYSLAYDASGVATITLLSPAIKAETSLSVSLYNTTALVVTADMITGVLGRISEVFQTFQRAPTMLLAPYANYDARVVAALAAATLNAGDGRLAIAYLDVPSRDLAFDGVNITGVISSTGVLAAKPISNNRVIAVWGAGCVGPERFDGSCVFAVERARVDADNGFPYVSPGNRALFITSAALETDGTETAMMVSRDQMNEDVCANGVVGFLSTGAGWVLWGEWTTAAPATTDIKDQFHSTRAMMDYLRNDFLGAMAARISLPLNLRQVDGILKSYSDRLGFFVGTGAIASGNISLDTEVTTTTELLSGNLTFRLLVTPPPPIVSITGVFEWDAETFTAIIREAA